MMIEIIGEREIIQIDIIEYITDNKWLQSGDYIKCNIYFEKFECKFTSKDVVISYDMLKNFNVNLKQLLNNKKECCSLIDQNSVVSLQFEVDKSTPNSLVDYNNYALEFKFFYYAGSCITLTGCLILCESSLNSLVKEIEFLL